MNLGGGTMAGENAAIVTANGGQLSGRMVVWIDQDLCTGDANCATNVPGVFEMRGGLAFVSGNGEKFDKGGAMAIAYVSEPDVLATIDEAEDCPGECIFIEIDGGTVNAETGLAL